MLLDALSLSEPKLTCIKLDMETALLLDTTPPVDTKASACRRNTHQLGPGGGGGSCHAGTVCSDVRGTVSTEDTIDNTHAPRCVYFTRGQTLAAPAGRVAWLSVVLHRKAHRARILRSKTDRHTHCTAGNHEKHTWICIVTAMITAERQQFRVEVILAGGECWLLAEVGARR